MLSGWSAGRDSQTPRNKSAKKSPKKWSPGSHVQPLRVRASREVRPRPTKTQTNQTQNDQAQTNQAEQSRSAECHIDSLRSAAITDEGHRDCRLGRIEPGGGDQAVGG